MGHSRDTSRLRQGMTLVEMLMSMVILMVVFAVIAPQFRVIQNSWSSKRENTEVIQNGRVLMDHITFNLTQADRITAVSDLSETNGYIEFEDNDGNAMRYEIDANNYAVFGPVGSLSELAGPVSQLQFSCYDACDLDTALEAPIDVNQVRTVKVQSTVINSAALGSDQSFIAQAYLRTNYSGGGGSGQTVSEVSGSEFEFDMDNGQGGVLSRVDAEHYLCVYKGKGGATGTGQAVVLSVDTDNWTISSGTLLEFDSACGGSDLIPIDATNYLCVYQGDKGDGYAVVLRVNPVTWRVSAGQLYEFDTQDCSGPRLSQIDSDDFLCAYQGLNDDGYAVILTVNALTRTVTSGTAFEFDTDDAGHIALSNIDNTHHLCAYGNQLLAGLAVVLTADTVTKTVTKEGSPFNYEMQQAMHNELIKIDQNHYLCGFRGWGESGQAFIMTVDTGTWAVGKGATILYDTSDEPQSEYPDFAWISGNDYLCAYTGSAASDADIGKAVVLTVDTQTDTVTKGTDFIHDVEGVTPDLAKVDDSHYLCAYEGLFNDGFATILTVGEQILP